MVHFALRLINAPPSAIFFLCVKKRDEPWANFSDMVFVNKMTSLTPLSHARNRHATALARTASTPQQIATPRSGSQPPPCDTQRTPPDHLPSGNTRSGGP